MKSKALPRAASHAGSWYSKHKEDLNKQLSQFLSASASKVSKEGKPLLKALISPHAGYRWCGDTAAFAYTNIVPSKYKRVVLLGPSHHKFIPGCGLSMASQFQTPLGSIKIDREVMDQLIQKSDFYEIPQDVDEAEHSLEMQLPYLRKMFSDSEGTALDFKLVPIMVGMIQEEKQKYFGEILAPFLKEEDTLFVVSTDFCHWGARFRFQHYQEEDGAIWESIEALDKLGFSHIENQSAKDFVAYLKASKNTICGRYAVAVYLNALEASGLKTKTELLKYSQSSKVTSMSDSSVSYVAACTTLLE